MSPEEHLGNLIQKYKKPGKWASGIFADVKNLSATDKGQLAEDFIVWIARHYHMEADSSGSRLGEFDVMVNERKLEVKMASEDVSGNFQFNGVRYDTRYEILCVLGISPNEIYFNLYPKNVLIDLPLVRMAKSTNSTFKLTRPKNLLYPITEFKNMFVKLEKSKE